MSRTSLAHGLPAPRADAIAAHEAARAAWAGATTAADVMAARGLSRAAMLLAAMDTAWLEQLDAACIDAEAEHAADLHAQAAGRLHSTPTQTQSRPAGR
jgi:hypothetical protein